jgi:hypothetical protein
VRFSFKARGSEAERVKSREVTSLNKIALGGIQLCDPFHPFQSTASQKIRPKSTALEPERPERPEQTRLPKNKTFCSIPVTKNAETPCFERSIPKST